MELRDPVASLSHLATAVWAAFATAVLLRLATGRRRRAAVAVYGASMVFVFLASGAFHGLHYQTNDQLRFFQKLDQTAIYLMIAGTNTPIAAFLLGGAFRRRMLALIWGLAFLGVGFQWLVPQAPHAAIVGVCLGLGFLGLVPLVAYYRALGWRAMGWVWLGVGLYTAGGVFELCRWPVVVPGWVSFHEVFHLCVSGGAVCFFVFIARHVVGHAPLAG